MAFSAMGRAGFLLTPRCVGTAQGKALLSPCSGDVPALQRPRQRTGSSRHKVAAKHLPAARAARQRKQGTPAAGLQSPKAAEPWGCPSPPPLAQSLPRAAHTGGLRDP